MIAKKTVLCWDVKKAILFANTGANAGVDLGTNSTKNLIIKT